MSAVRGRYSRKNLGAGWGRGPWKVSTIERQKIQVCNNSRTTYIAEPVSVAKLGACMEEKWARRRHKIRPI